MIRSSLGPYEISEQLGAGGMGNVYLAVDNRRGRRVARCANRGVAQVAFTSTNSNSEATAISVRRAHRLCGKRVPHQTAVVAAVEIDASAFDVDGEAPS